MKIENIAALPTANYHGDVQIKNAAIKNGLRGVHIATGSTVVILLNYKEMQLALDNTHPNESWDLMCEAVKARNGTEIQGQIEIDYIYVEGVRHNFH